MATAPDSPAWLADRKYNEGIGVRAGDLELHPGIAGQFGYDSNYLLRSDDTGVANGPPIAPVIPALEFLVTPSFYLNTLSQERRDDQGATTPAPLAFRMGVNATYRELIGLSSDSNSGSSTNDISKQRNVSGAADARLDILPGRPWGGAIFANYSRAILPNSVDANPDLSFNQDVVGVGAEISAQPGSGTLDWHWGYSLTDTIFEEAAGVPYDNLVHQAYTRGSWRFRPRTALMYDASLRFISYGNESNAVNTALDTSTPVRTRLGINGLVTDRFSVLAMVGWGASFYDTRIPHVSQFDSIIAQGELRWFLSASPGVAKANELGLTLSNIALGYTRDFQNSYLGDYYTEDRGYLKFSYLFAGRAVVTLDGGVGAIEYPTILWDDGTQRNPAFTDVRADATLFGEYRFTDTFGLNATLKYSANISKTEILVSEPVTGTMTPSPNTYAMQWKRFEAYLGLRFFL